MREFLCRKAAVISDIHSNYHAFRACYEDAKKQGADLFIFLGDYISDLASPVETLDLVYEIRAQYPSVCLRGNRERYMLECKRGEVAFSPGSKSGSLLYTYSKLRPQDFEFIESVPIYDQIRINGVPFEVAHAVRDNDRFYFDSDDGHIVDAFKKMEHPYLLTGHAHKQYIRQQEGKTIINPGSVGIPMGGARWPQYALLEVAGSAVRWELRSVPYDLRCTVQAQFEKGLVAQATYWAIAILYDVLRGQAYTLRLLGQVSGSGDVQNEENWRSAATAMGMKLTESEILNMIKPIETAYFAGGCFWCITPTFKETDGVLDVVSGYSGGREANPTYADVKQQKTRHRETIRVDFEPETVTFEQLLDMFLSGVDPFDPDGQFIDRGHSYTLAVYYCSEAQRKAAEAAVGALEAESGQNVYVSIEPFTAFYRAEEEHQDYYLKHPEEFRQELIQSGRLKV